jgi:hypothetical protein
MYDDEQDDARREWQFLLAERLSASGYDEDEDD